jgi:hypothetical protein
MGQGLRLNSMTDKRHLALHGQSLEMMQVLGLRRLVTALKKRDLSLLLAEYAGY